jgi:hypothetical protein
VYIYKIKKVFKKNFSWGMSLAELLPGAKGEPSEGNLNLIDPPIKKKLGPPVVSLKGVCKYYNLAGNDETVRALEGITLAPDSEFYPIRKVFKLSFMFFSLFLLLSS